MFINKKQRDQESDNLPFFKSIGLFLWEIAKVIIISLIIIIPVRFYVIQPFYVKGASMEPNFHDKEYLVIDEISYQFHEVERGDIVVFRYPKDPKQFFIKRVIGLPNETIVLHEGGITIINTLQPQGFDLDESEYLSEKVETRGELHITLKDNEYFMMGDNRTSSLDSRLFGPVTRQAIVGRVWLRGWPLDRATLFTEHGEPHILHQNVEK